MNFEQRRAARQVMRHLADAEVAAEVLTLLRRRYGADGRYTDDPDMVEIIQRVDTLASRNPYPQPQRYRPARPDEWPGWDG